MKPFQRPATVLLLLAGLIGLPIAKADILRLRDGRMLTGEFLGATRDQIWFQSDSPVNIIGPTAYAVVQVESLTFGPVAKQSDAAKNVAPSCNATNLRNPVDVILVALASDSRKDSQKTDRPPDQ